MSLSHHNTSFWETSTFLAQQDFLVVGAGIVGLSTALELKKKCPKAKITILERGILPSGASSKNAGFACFGSISELLQHEAKEGLEAMLKLVRMRYEGLQLLLKNVDPSDVEYSQSGNYEIFTTGQNDLYEKCISNIARINSLLKSELGIENIFSTQDQSISNFGFKAVEHLIFNRAEGQLNSGKLIQSLIKSVHKSDVQILNGFEVSKITSSSQDVLIEAKAGYSISGKKLIVTTNAFTRDVLPELTSEIVPGRGQVLVTKPIPKLKVKGCFHLEEGYFYFRNVGDDRVLFGGGRNLDFLGEQTTEFGLTDLIQTKLEQLMRQVILPGNQFEIDSRWSGIMCFGPKIEPIVKQIRPNIFCAVRMSGMGVALGSLIAEQVTALALR